VTGPDAKLRRNIREERRRWSLPLDANGRMTELALGCGRDGSAERTGHQLHAVTNPKHRSAESKDRGITSRGTRLKHAPGSSRQNDPDGAALSNPLQGYVGRPDLRIDRELPEASRNQLGVLRPEIEDDDGLMVHESEDGPRPECSGRGRFEAIIAVCRCGGPQYLVVS